MSINGLLISRQHQKRIAELETEKQALKGVINRLNSERAHQLSTNRKQEARIAELEDEIQRLREELSDRVGELETEVERLREENRCLTKAKIVKIPLSALLEKGE